MLIEKYAKMGERGQVTIPKEMRERNNMKPGDLVKIIYPEGGTIIIRKVQDEFKDDKEIIKAIKEKGID